MSLNLPRQWPQRIGSPLKPPLITPFCHKQHRTLFGGWGLNPKKHKKDPPATQFAPQNPLTEDFLKKKPKQQPPRPGDLAKSSIFEDEEATGPKKEEKQPRVRDPHTMAAALDPRPKARMRWERKMVIRQIRRRGRLSKAQLLNRQERQSVSRSHDFETSIKKLVPLAKQIAGKPINDAITQMRFSKKKAAKDVKAHLIHARNEAIVKRGMGLGRVSNEVDEFKPVNIVTKDKRFIQVKDPTTIYVDQAWCGKGLYGREWDHRAFGRINMMRNRTTSLTVLLKEEKTRIRLHKEREEKINNRKVWVQLPNRPVTAQRQYYSW